MNKINILLAEDDLNLGSILKDFLQVKGYSVVHCLDGVSAFSEFNSGCFELCLLDIMMPKLDGFSLAKKIRESDSVIPIIFLTAKSMQHDKIEGFKLGADDYITKPFNTEELLLRIKAIVKRLGTKRTGEKLKNNFIIGKFVFDYDTRMLTNADKKKLTTKEAELLKLLCVNINEVLERSAALKTIWKEDNYFTSRSMDVYITKLRNYLKEDPAVEIINAHGHGYKLIVHSN